jgi:Na+-transporting NADH:ubiquinone oxidoreductase subunit A
MAVHRIRRGLDLPISGEPEQKIDAAPSITQVALLGDDHHGLRARLAVQEGERIARGQLLFEDRTRPGVRFTAPGAGEVIAIHRGARRVLQSVTIRLSDSERSGEPRGSECADFESFRGGGDPRSLSGEAVRSLLVESGLWTALRERPFGKVPLPESRPHALFVNAMESQPLAPDPAVVIAERRADFELGLHLAAKLCEGTTFLCVAAGSDIAKSVDAPVAVEEFAGPHPAGTSGLHIHLLAPVGRTRTAWTLGYQDVIAFGALFRSGRLPVERVISLAGPAALRPRLVRSRLGASVGEHTAGEVAPGEVRAISGSVIAGKKAMGPVYGFLSRHHQQISLIAEGREREFFGWARPGPNRYSVLPIFTSRLRRGKRFDFTTATHGSRRAIVPIGLYERVMPMDILATYLLRALSVGDIEQAEKLGCLELEEEDLALCTFVCPCKVEYGPLLRATLDRIEKEG